MNETGTRQRADNISGLLGEKEMASYIYSQPKEKLSGYFIQIGIDDFGMINNVHGQLTHAGMSLSTPPQREPLRDRPGLTSHVVRRLLLWAFLVGGIKAAGRRWASRCMPTASTRQPRHPAPVDRPFCGALAAGQERLGLRPRPDRAAAEGLHPVARRVGGTPQPQRAGAAPLRRPAALARHLRTQPPADLRGRRAAP